MFNRKRNLTKTTSGKGETNKNSFLKHGFQKDNITRTQNGAVTYKSTNNELVDQYIKASSYLIPRDWSEIERDCAALWAETDPNTFLKFTFFLRMITRKSVIEGDKVQANGQGYKHEAIMRLMWLAVNHTNLFEKNMHLIPAYGSWKDVFEMLRIDIQSNEWGSRQLNWNNFLTLIVNGLADEQHCELVKKYLPQIYSKSKITTNRKAANSIIGNWLASKITVSDKKAYRKLKSFGTAHTWQQKISRGQFDKIDFDEIHGRALSKIVNGKFLVNQGLYDKYTKWVSDDKKSEIKYTGYVHELLYPLQDRYDYNPLDKATKVTINKQFEKLVRDADANGDSNLLVVRDISASMGVLIDGTHTAFHIAKSISLLMGAHLDGEFKDTCLLFDSSVKLIKYKGSNIVEKYQSDRSSYVGSTDFQKVVNFFIRLYKEGADLKDFPKGFIAISDGEFNRASTQVSNIELAFEKIEKAFPKEYADDFKIILWDLKGGKTEVRQPTTKNFAYLSGFDGSMVKFVMNAKDLSILSVIEGALSQEALNYVVTD